MKKVLSFILLLAMLISCVSMVSFTSASASAEAPLAQAEDEFLGWKVTATKDFSGDLNYCTTDRSKGLFTVDDRDKNGNITHTFTIINPNDHAIRISLWWQATLKWPSGTSETWATYVSQYITINAKSSKSATISFTADENGNVKFSRTTPNESVDVDISKVFFRFDLCCSNNKIYKDEYFILLTDDNVFENQTPAGTGLLLEKFTESSYDQLDYYTLKNADAELGDTTGWGGINGNSDITNIPESEITGNPEDTNRVIKFSPETGGSNSIFYDLSPAIFNDRNNFYNGGGPGRYQITFRHRTTDAENSGKFMMYLTSKGAGAYASDTFITFIPDSFVMNGEWTYYTGTVEITEDFYNTLYALKAAGICFGFEDGVKFDYVVDDVEFKKVSDTPVGVQYYVTQALTGKGAYFYRHHGIAKLTNEDVVTDANGKLHIPVRYTVYNPNSFDLPIQIYIQNYWSTPSGVGTGTQTIPAGKSMEIGFNINVIKIDDIYYYATSQGVIYEDIRKANLRVDTGTVALPVGTTFFIKARKADDPIYTGITATQPTQMSRMNGTGTAYAAFAYDFPDLEEAASTAHVHTAHYFVAKKITFTAGSNHYYAAGKIFALDKNNEYFTGTKKISYTVYNPTNKVLTASLQFQAIVNEGWVGGDAVKDTQTILPGTKKTLTTTLEFKDGVAVMTNGDVSMDVKVTDIFPRFSFSFISEAAGDYLYIEANSFYDAVLTKDIIGHGGLSHEGVYAIPEVYADSAVYYGAKVTANKTFKDEQYARVLAKLTPEMADENGIITKSYTVYNDSSEPIRMRFEHQSGNAPGRESWDNLSCENASLTATINPNQTHTFTINIQLEEDGTVKYRARKIKLDENGEIVKDDAGKIVYEKDDKGATIYEDAFCPLYDYTYFRFSLVKSSDYPQTITEGSSFYIIPENTDPATEALAHILPSNISGNSFTVEHLYSSLNGENKIQGATVEVGSSLTVNYYATILNVLDKAPVLRVTRGNDTRDITATIDNGMYKFAYTGVNAQCMTDNIKAELLYNGHLLDSKDEYSVKAYAINLYTSEKAPASDELKALLTDMLYYGAEAQKIIGYKTDNLATKDIDDWTASSHAIPQFGDKNVIREATQKDQTNRVSAVGLNISHVNRIYFRLELTDEVEFALTRDGVEVEFEYVIEDGLLYTDAINATGFDDKFTLTITKDGEEISTVSYNVNAYIASKYNSDSVGGIVTALNNYGISAVNYGATISK
jgi:hypothetical protein